jgi:uncharacterized protein (TIGR02996 family)
MAHNDAFLQAIYADPDDDTPRLIYADWLEEQGDALLAAWAELIRIQVAVAGPGVNRFSRRRRNALARREQALLAAHSAAWLGPWAAAPIRWAFRRGFPERLSGVAFNGLRWQLDLGGSVGVSSGDRNDEEYWLGSYHIGFFPNGPLVRIGLWFHRLRDRQVYPDWLGIIPQPEAQEDGIDVTLHGRFFHDETGVGIALDDLPKVGSLKKRGKETMRFAEDW